MDRLIRQQLGLAKIHNFLSIYNVISSILTAVKSVLEEDIGLDGTGAAFGASVGIGAAATAAAAAAGAASAGFGSAAFAAGAAGAAPPAPSSISKSGVPGVTVSPSSTRSLVTTPAAGAFTGREVLSVSTSPTVSSKVTESPTSFIHEISPSEIESANGGHSTIRANNSGLIVSGRAT